jgi:hypothetical protein
MKLQPFFPLNSEISAEAAKRHEKERERELALWSQGHGLALIVLLHKLLATQPSQLYLVSEQHQNGKDHQREEPKRAVFSVQKDTLVRKALTNKHTERKDAQGESYRSRPRGGCWGGTQAHYFNAESSVLQNKGKVSKTARIISRMDRA